MLYDTHMHFDTFAAEDRVDDVLRAAADAGVTRLTAIGGSDEANALAISVAAQYEHICCTVGYDRDEAGKQQEPSVRHLCDQEHVRGIGETGLDYHYSAETRAEQMKLFECMLSDAAAAELPVIVHSREADEDTLGLLRDYVSAVKNVHIPGVLHCFTGSRAFAFDLMDLGFMISFSGIVTFRKAEELRTVAQAVPDEYLLIETDAPYLAPEPKRGKPNEPAYLRYTAEALAGYRDVSLEHLARITTANANMLYQWEEAE